MVRNNVCVCMCMQYESLICVNWENKALGTERRITGENRLHNTKDFKQTSRPIDSLNFKWFFIYPCSSLCISQQIVHSLSVSLLAPFVCICFLRADLLCGYSWASFIRQSLSSRCACAYEIELTLGMNRGKFIKKSLSQQQPLKHVEIQTK